MLRPEQQRLYIELSGQLQTIGMHYYRELPSGSTSLLMNVNKGEVLVQVYDRQGKLIGTVPNEKTSAALRADLQKTFSDSVSPDPHGVIALISVPTTNAEP